MGLAEFGVFMFVVFACESQHSEWQKSEVKRFLEKQVGVSKNRGKTPKMDGL